MPAPDATTSVLAQIIDGVREDLAERQAATPLRELEARVQEVAPPLDAVTALTGPALSLIAEVKRKSPSKGALADIPDPAALAGIYADAGANAISVLTERRRFGGSLADLDAVREAVSIPVLRKDFMVEDYQFWEARAHGADLVLLIVAALDDARLRDFLQLTHHLGMTALVETHDAGEVERALAVGARVVGVNARNLKTLEVHPGVYGELAPLLPEGVVRVAESGITGPEDAQRYADQGATAVLVGEALVTATDGPAETVRAITSIPVRRPGTAYPAAAQDGEA